MIANVGIIRNFQLPNGSNVCITWISGVFDPCQVCVAPRIRFQTLIGPQHYEVHSGERNVDSAMMNLAQSAVVCTPAASSVGLLFTI